MTCSTMLEQIFLPGATEPLGAIKYMSRKAATSVHAVYIEHYYTNS